MKLSNLDLAENISALIIAILREDVYMVEDAFKILEDLKTIGYRKYIDKDELVNLRDMGVTYSELSKIYGLSINTLTGTVSRHRKKKERRLV